eukprot:1161324-Pelagomonas_calceolata.AAC.6
MHRSTRTSPTPYAHSLPAPDVRSPFQVYEGSLSCDPSLIQVYEGLLGLPTCLNHIATAELIRTCPRPDVHHTA